MNRSTSRSAVIALTLLCLALPSVRKVAAEDDPAAQSSARADALPPQEPEASSTFIPADYPSPFGASLQDAWLDAWPHTHFSRRGTPFVHLFSLEPAFLDRDLFFDYRHIRAPDVQEAELEIELEWAFTRRIGLVMEGPLVQVNPDDGATELGLGDVAVAPRFLLVDTERLLVSGNLEVSLPTGRSSRSLGAGEAALAPSLSAWTDLGNWITLSTQIGTEHGLESGDCKLFYNAALAYSFVGPRLFRPGHSHAAYSHFPPGLTSLIGEFTGRTILNGEDERASTAELLLGVSYNLTEYWEVRSGYQLPLGDPNEIDYGLIFSVIYHF